MIPRDKAVILASGESLTAAEVFEGLLRLAQSESSFPLLGGSDLAQAVIAVAFQALAFNDDEEILP